MIPFFDYKISKTLPAELPTDKIVINTINPHSFCAANSDKDFKLALLDSDILIPDGIGIVWGVKMLEGIKINKIAGFDLHLHCLKLLENKGGGKVFYLGASQDTLIKIKEKITKEYPMIEVGFYSPPYKPLFTEEENNEMISRINMFSPDILFVGMTAPKQEKWVHLHKTFVNVKIICSIGAVFDFYSGTVKRPSQFWIKLGLEWLPRFLKEPKRLAKRNLISTPSFIYYVFIKKIKKFFF